MVSTCDFLRSKLVWASPCIEKWLIALSIGIIQINVVSISPHESSTSILNEVLLCWGCLHITRTWTSWDGIRVCKQSGEACDETKHSSKWTYQELVRSSQCSSCGVSSLWYTSNINFGRINLSTCCVQLAKLLINSLVDEVNCLVEIWLDNRWWEIDGSSSLIAIWIHGRPLRCVGQLCSPGDEIEPRVLSGSNRCDHVGCCLRSNIPLVSRMKWSTWLKLCCVSICLSTHSMQKNHGVFVSGCWVDIIPCWSRRFRVCWAIRGCSDHLITRIGLECETRTCPATPLHVAGVVILS